MCISICLIYIIFLELIVYSIFSICFRNVSPVTCKTKVGRCTAGYYQFPMMQTQLAPGDSAGTSSVGHWKKGALFAMAQTRFVAQMFDATQLSFGVLLPAVHSSDMSNTVFESLYD